MEITLNENELIFYLDLFLTSKTIREILVQKLQDFETSDESSGSGSGSGSDDEKVLKMKIAKVELKKKRGRPKKEIQKTFNNIVIEEKKINLDI